MNSKEDSKAKIIGTALKEWIEKSRYSKADVARMLGVSPQYINGLCQGKPIGKCLAHAWSKNTVTARYISDDRMKVDHAFALVMDKVRG